MNRKAFLIAITSMTLLSQEGWAQSDSLANALSIGINGFTPGLQNAFFGAFFKPSDRFACSATYHYLATATELNNLNRTLGHSIDIEAKYKFTKDITLMAGYTQMHGTETMDRLKQGEGSKRAHWGWFSLVVSPSLFTSRW